MNTLTTALLLGGALGLAPPIDTAQVGDVAPEIEGEWLQSEVNSLAACRGRVVLIEFWRTW
ncbi:MAG: hypothetical protein QF903_11700 [Planctomycetota bacterium]|jgi:hypothetical protein|nr:hypothetical protein [Planctomycetota bacterium]MDP6763968.1 hypothetical protein [Planctomycetota bacterium]MDP6990124.1 hypothetical protein [Planctomycetota bacterium]